MNKRYQIQITSRAQRDYKRLDPHLISKIKNAIYSLATDPISAQSKHLKGDDLAQYRLRVGDYRILYDVYPKDKTILILRIGHRKDIYR